MFTLLAFATCTKLINTQGVLGLNILQGWRGVFKCLNQKSSNDVTDTHTRTKPFIVKDYMTDRQTDRRTQPFIVKDTSLTSHPESWRQCRWTGCRWRARTPPSPRACWSRGWAACPGPHTPLGHLWGQICRYMPALTWQWNTTWI